MVATTHVARVVGPVEFTNSRGRRDTIPLGPCFVEEAGDDSTSVFWGPTGERSAFLSPREAAKAADEGNLVLLDRVA